MAIVLGLLLTVVVALGIMLVVAVPSLRQGSRILTPEGERAVERAKRQAKAKPRAAAGTTWSGLVGLRRRISRTWAPASAALHDAFDRLENRPSDPAATPIRHASAGSSGSPTGAAAVGRPRSAPAISGPIPEIKPGPAVRAGEGERVIDLREDTQDDADQPAGSARPAR